MKKILNYTLVLSSLVLAVLPSCRKEEVNENTFTITPKVIRATTATFEVIPENNEFYYYADAITVAEYNRIGEQYIADSIMLYYDRVKERLDKEGIHYDNDFLYYRGLFDCPTTKLPPETNCYFFCMRLDSKHQRPILPLCKVPFSTTKDIQHPDFAVTISLTGDSICYVPNADYPYLADFVSWKDLRRDYAGDPEFYFSSTLATYEAYDLMNQVVVTGPVSYSILDWYPDLQPGDSIFAYGIGYEQHNLTTDILGKTLIIQ